MKIRHFISLSLLACCSLSSRAQNIHSIWLSTPVTVDGNPDEWPQPFRYYDGTTKLQFAFANDTANLYVCLKITDEATQMRLFRGGFAVWVDAKGKKKETAGIMFPTKQEQMPDGPQHRKRQEGFEQSAEDQRNDIIRLRQHTFAQQTMLRIKGFIGAPEQMLPLQNNYGINAAFNWDSLNILCIEYKIPLALATGHALSFDDTTKPFSIGFIENALEAPKGKNFGEGDAAIDMSRQSNMDRGGMNSAGMNNGGYGAGNYGGMGGGGYGGGRMGGGMNSAEISVIQQDQKLWSKVFLSFGK